MESRGLMPKKRLDDTTLEAISEIICGSGQGAGGGPTYRAPGPYRSKSEIHSFFNRSISLKSIDRTHESATAIYRLMRIEGIELIHDISKTSN